MRCTECPSFVSSPCDDIQHLYIADFPVSEYCRAITKEDARRINAIAPSTVSPYGSRHQVVEMVSLHLQQWSSTPDQPTSTHGNYPGTASNPIRAYRPNGRQCRRKADLDFLAFCVLEETTTGRPRMTWMKTVQNDIDSTGCHGPKHVNLAQNRPLWRLLATSGTTQYALAVVQAGEEEVEEEEEEDATAINETTTTGITIANAVNNTHARNSLIQVYSQFK